MGTGRVAELIMEDGCRYGRLACPEPMVPAPGQFLLASDGPAAVLPVPLFYTDSDPQGFICPAPAGWKPGDTLYLRGPLGRGFSLPPSARRVGLIAYGGPYSRLRGLIGPALRQNASLVLVTSSEAGSLPDEVEIQPASALEEILAWADYLAIDLQREDLPTWKARLEQRDGRRALPQAQVLVHTAMPCGGIAECGACALPAKEEWKLACKEGPVFDLRDL